MTAMKPREPGTFEDAISRIVGELTAAGAGEIIGKSKSRIYAAMDADASNHSQLDLDQALKLDIEHHNATGEEGPILRAYREQYETAISEMSDGLSLVARMGLISKEVGEAIQSLAVGTDPTGPRGGEMTRREALNSLKELDDAKRVIEATQDAIRRQAGISEADTPPATIKAA